MIIVKWIVLCLLSVAAGYLFVQYLTVPPNMMATFVLLLAIAGAVLALLLARGFPGWRLAGALVAVVLFFAVGYLVTTSRLLAREEERALPELRPAMANHTAVVYLTHGEPPAYSPMPWIETFKELDSDRVSFIPVPFRTFFISALRDHYLKVGGSPHNFVHAAMLSSLEEMFRKEGDTTTRFYISFLDSNPRPDEAVINAVNDGASRIILANVFLTISSHTKAGAEQVEEVGLAEYNIPVCKTEPLYNSSYLKRMFVERANRNLHGTPKEKVGILLVGHGQPEDWDRIYASQTEQEMSFRREVLELLVQDGYQRENVSLAWMEFKEPGIAEKALQLAGQGIDKLFVFAASISAASLHSEYDIPTAVHEAGLPANVQVVNLGAWNNDPLVIRAIHEKIHACLP